MVCTVYPGIHTTGVDVPQEDRAMKDSPMEELRSLAKLWGVSVGSAEFARRLDETDPLRSYRDRFSVPKMVDVSVGKNLDGCAASPIP